MSIALIGLIIDVCCVVSRIGFGGDSETVFPSRFGFDNETVLLSCLGFESETRVLAHGPPQHSKPQCNNTPTPRARPVGGRLASHTLTVHFKRNRGLRKPRKIIFLLLAKVKTLKCEVTILSMARR